MRIEEQIRDYLAENIEFISCDLELIQKEFYLPALIGSKGFVDILAKDKFNNFVIIEIKRSEQAARQAINELLKYKGLIKQLFKAQESEIKLIIISTSWNELIVPYSEIYKNELINGYKIELNSLNIPYRISYVEPDTSSIERKISPMQIVELFFTDEKRESFIKVIKNKLLKFGIEDYILLKLNSNGTNKRIRFPFALYFAFQRQSIEKNHKIIPNLDEIISNALIENEDHKLYFIDEIFYEKLDMYKYHDSMEASDPYKFTTILQSEQWEIIDIYKNGIFINDPRINNEQIINEIKGYDGDNASKFLDSTESKNTKKIIKIENRINKYLQKNINLQRHVNLILKNSIAKNINFDIVIDIFYPRSLFDSVWRYYNTLDINYLPNYNIFIFFYGADFAEQYTGNLVWKGKFVDIKKVITKFENNDSFDFIGCVNGIFDDELLKLMNIDFVHEYKIISNAEINSCKQIKQRNSEFITDDFNYRSMGTFYKSNEKLMNMISGYYLKFTKN